MYGMLRAFIHCFDAKCQCVNVDPLVAVVGEILPLLWDTNTISIVIALY